METIKQAIVQADTKLGGIPREYLYDGDRLIETYIVRVDGERYRMVDRKAEIGEKVIITDGDDKNRIGVVCDYYPELGISVDTGDDLSYYPVAYDGEYHVLEPMKHYCGWCSAELGEIACSNNRGGSYCSVQCADADEEVESQPLTLDAEGVRLDPEKVIDMITELSKTVAQQQREIDRLKSLTEDNAKNTLAFAEDLEEYKEVTRLNEENLLGIYEDLGEVKSRQEHTQGQASRVDLTTEFLISDLATITERLLRMTGGEGR